MSDRYQQLRQSSRQGLRRQDKTPMKNSGLGPTLTFKEVVAQFELSSGKLRSAVRHDPDAPKPRSVFSTAHSSNVYYDRAEIVKYVKANLEKLK